jgi:putative DNA primase/helicase
METMARLGRQTLGIRQHRPGSPLDEGDHALDDGRGVGVRQRQPGLECTPRRVIPQRCRCLTLASTEEGIALTRDDLDAHPLLLNCQNGVLDLRTGTLGPHDPELQLTKLTGAAYDPDAAGPEFEKFLCRVQPDPELLNARTFAAHPTGVADLFGLRLAVLHESDQGRRLAEGTIKRLTRGDRIKARRMREDFWTFRPSHLFVMLTSHAPVVGGSDERIWRRLRLVSWPVIIKAGERELRLGDKLAEELDAVLAFLVAGYQDWRDEGLNDPAGVTKAMPDFRAESDSLGRFIEQRCLTGPHFSLRSADLFAAWCTWCRAECEEPGSQTDFPIAMTDAGFDKRKTKIGAVWHGIGLAADDDG